MRKLSIGMMLLATALSLARCQHGPGAAAQPPPTARDAEPAPAHESPAAAPPAEPSPEDRAVAIREVISKDEIERILNQRSWVWVQSNHYVNGIILEEYKAQWSWKLPAGGTAKIEGYVANDGLKAKVLFEVPFSLPK